MYLILVKRFFPARQNNLLFIVYCLIILFCFTGSTHSAQTLAADFQLSDPGIELRKIQICKHCSKPLIVTSIAPGAAVRCPHCQHVQRRLPDSELQTKVYQICPSCSCRLDVSGMKPLEAFKCGSCGFEQRVLPEAVYLPPSDAGTGSIPAQKTILAAPKLTLPPKKQLPEPVVPGLNAKGSPVAPEFSIEIEKKIP